MREKHGKTAYWGSVGRTGGGRVSSSRRPQGTGPVLSRVVWGLPWAEEGSGKAAVCLCVGWFAHGWRADSTAC